MFNLLELKNITKEYKESNNISSLILDSLSYTFNEKGLYFITDPSGSGKTTIINLISGFLKPTSGEIIYNDIRIDKLDNHSLSEYWANEISFVFQEYNLIESLTVYENISMPLALERKPVIADEIDSIMDMLEIKKLKNRRINELSGGERQRVAVGRALARKSSILICDEPTGALDEENSNRLLRYLKRISTEKLVIVVSHNMKLARSYADYILNIEGKKLVEECNQPLYIEKSEIKDDNYFIKAKHKHNPSLKMSFHYLFKKKLRLIASLLFIITAMVIFSIVSSFYTYSKNDAIINEMSKANEKYISVSEKIDSISKRDFEYSKLINMSEVTANSLASALDLPLLKSYSYFLENMPATNSMLQISGFTEIDEEQLELYGFSLDGRLPNSYNEAVVTKLFYEAYKSNGFNDEYIEKPDDLIGRSIALKPIKDMEEEIEFKITGIIDTGFNYKAYSRLNDDTISEDEYNILIDELKAGLEAALHNTIFLKHGYYDNIIKPIRDNNIFNENRIIISSDKAFVKDDEPFAGIMNRLSANTPASEITYINDFSNGVIVPLNLFYTDISSLMRMYAEEYAISVYPLIEDEFKKDYPHSKGYSDYLKYLWKNDYFDLKYQPISKQEYKDYVVKKHVAKIFKDDYNVGLEYKIDQESSVELNIPIKGIYYSEHENYNSDIAYCDQSLIAEIRNKLSYLENDISFVALPFSNNKSVNTGYLDKLNRITPNEYINNPYGEEITGICYDIRNEYSYSYDMIYSDIEGVSSILIICGSISLLLFIVFLIMYINGVIQDRAREVGILKSLGINNKSIYKIFISIVLMFSAIAIIIGLILSPALVEVLNKIMCSDYLAIFSRFIRLGAYEYIFIIFAPLVTSLAIMVLPLRAWLRKPVLDVLKNK